MCLHCVHILLYQSLFSCLLFCSSEKNPVFFSAELFVCVFHLVFFICMCLKHLINYPDTICIYYFRCDKNPLPSIGFVLTSSHLVGCFPCLNFPNVTRRRFDEVLSGKVKCCPRHSTVSHTERIVRVPD